MAEEITVETAAETIAPTKPLQETFSREYVEALRGESKGTRLELKSARDEAKNFASKLKSLIGLTPDEDIDDAKIAAYQTKLQQDSTNAISKANERLIQAEIKNLDGYDSKLLLKLLDMSKVTIADDGTVTGLAEAATALAAEYPSVKINQTQSSANPATSNSSVTDAETAKLRKAMGLKPL